MTTFFEIVLLIVGSASTLAAFGGETTIKGDGPLFERITTRGWVSLACLVLALVIGTTKQIVSRSDEESKNAIADKQKLVEKAEADRKQAELRSELAQSKLREDAANQHLIDLQAIDQLTQDRLGDTKVTLNDVRANLSTTRADLTQQSQTNLLAAVANANQKVKNVMFYIPFTQKAPKAVSLRSALLPTFSDSVCRDLASADVSIKVQPSDSEHFTYAPGDPLDEHVYRAAGIGKVDALLHFGADESATLSILSHFANQRTTNGYGYFAGIDMMSTSPSAAQLYAGFTQTGVSGDELARMEFAPITVSVGWPNVSDGTAAQHPEILNWLLIAKPGDSSGDKDLIRDLNQRHFPAACSDELKKHFFSVFDKAVVIVALDGVQNQSMIFKLKAQAPVWVHNMWSVSFVQDAAPIVSSFSDTYFRDISSLFKSTSK